MRSEVESAPGRRSGPAFLALLFTLVLPVAGARAEPPSMDDILIRLQRLEENQNKFDQLLKEKDDRIRQLEAELARSPEKVQTSVAVAPPQAPSDEPPPPPQRSGLESATDVIKARAQDQGDGNFFDLYTPDKGFRFVRSPDGEINLSALAYLRYLNQTALDDQYTDHFGNEKELDLRNDLQMSKTVLYSKGWAYVPEFNYNLFIWSSNNNMGLGAQVVVAGFLGYKFGDALTLMGGVGALPSSRTNMGSFPYWLTVDHRTMADEFFRASYTQGVTAEGKIADGLQYRSMIGNNLANLGVDAQQLDGDFSTFSTAVWWMPTTGEFGQRGAYGDYDEHEHLATQIGLHYTHSREDRQEQPGVNDIENSQIRISDGTIVFEPDVFAPNTRVNKVTYQMAAVDTGLKYEGFALEGEFFYRHLDDFSGVGPIPVTTLNDRGFQVMTSMMALPESVQLYAYHSKIYGEFGDPWDIGGGLNWYPFHRREIRWNFEYAYISHSPVGYLSVPYVVGGNGSLFSTSLVLYF